MRWWPFTALTLVLLTAQTAIAPHMEVMGARPDWLLVTVVFLSLYVPRRPATIGAWVLGIAADLATVERLGVIALSYGLIALAILQVRDFLFRHHWVTQLLVTLGACVVVRLGWMIYFHAMYDPAVSFSHDAWVHVIVGSVYTALWAPPIHATLLRMGRLLGVEKPRYTYAGLHRRGRIGV